MPETTPILVAIRKIQILADRATNHPLFYCHSADQGHNPTLLVTRDGDTIRIRARRMVYKVKFNPQTKNRVDIYMSLTQAHELGQVLHSLANSAVETILSEAMVSPGANAKGNMRLPTIHWTKATKVLRVAAQVDTGTKFPVRAYGNLYIDLESPHESHIKMVETELHMGIELSPPVGHHDVQLATPVNVPEHELQRGRSEENPIMKTEGDFLLEIASSEALGLANVLLVVGN